MGERQRRSKPSTRVIYYFPEYNRDPFFAETYNLIKPMSSSATGSALEPEGSRHFDVFCHMLIEDYLRRKNMPNTLDYFREEWGDDRPHEDDTVMSWYEIAMKLRLPEIIQEGSAGMSVVENLALALVRESSLRARRKIEVTVQGLCTMPKMKPLPNIQPPDMTADFTGLLSNGSNDISALLSDVIQEEDCSPGSPTTSQELGDGGGGVSTKGSGSGQLIQKKAPTPAVLAALQQKKEKQEAKAKFIAETAGKPKFISRAGQRVVLSAEAEAIVKIEKEKQEELKLKMNARKIKPSSENWIPDLERTRSLERDFKVLKDNMSDINKREMQEKREMKQFLVSDLEKARNAESLGQTHRYACGCCLQKYLPLNLPLRVSQKAVLDIRIKWGGSLNSKTVFGGVNPPVGQYLAGTEVAKDGTILNPEGTWSAAATAKLSPAEITNLINGDPAAKEKKKSYLDKIQDRLSRIPRCYADVPICTFCSQFFQNQLDYRPSYANIMFDERKSTYLEKRARARELLDPLKLVEKDREEAILMEEEMLKLAEEMAAIEMKDSDLGSGNAQQQDLDMMSP